MTGYLDANGDELNQAMFNQAFREMAEKGLKPAFALCSPETFVAMFTPKTMRIKIVEKTQPDVATVPIRQEVGYPSERVTFRDATGAVVFAIVNLKKAEMEVV